MPTSEIKKKRSPKRLALVFDFDDTLCHDSTSACLRSLGIDLDLFWGRDVVRLIHDGWDPVPAYFFQMVRWSQQQGRSITKEVFREAAETLTFYPGVPTFFDAIRECVARYDGQWQVEFYLISSGITEIVAHAAIAGQFTDIWAGEFEYDEQGSIAFPKRIVSFTDKTRYLFHISKGLIGDEARRNPFDVNKKVSFGEIAIPFENMIYLGDGYTDVPCFALLKKYGGFPIAVYDSEKTEGLKKAMHLHHEKRVVEYASANYCVQSPLFEQILQCVRTIVARAGV